jgi:hypothetical protein
MRLEIRGPTKRSSKNEQSAQPAQWSGRRDGALFAYPAFAARRHSPRAFGETMSAVTENEDWIVDRGALVIEKKAQSGADSLNEWERLVHCFWLADYMMRNAGDFANAKEMCPDFQRDAKRLAQQLSLPLTSEAFGLSQRKLQREYFERFEAMCDEIRSAEPGAGPNETERGQAS